MCVADHHNLSWKVETQALVSDMRRVPGSIAIHQDLPVAKGTHHDWYEEVSLRWWRRLLSGIVLMIV